MYWDPLHSLLEEGVHACLADEQVRPLDHHDAGKETGVTGILQLFPLVVALGHGQRINRETLKPCTAHYCGSGWLYGRAKSSAWIKPLTMHLSPML